MDRREKKTHTTSKAIGLSDKIVCMFFELHVFYWAFKSYNDIHARIFKQTTFAYFELGVTYYGHFY